MENDEWDDRPHLNPLPPGEDFARHVSGQLEVAIANPIAGIAQPQQPFPPLLEERAGVRTVVPLTFIPWPLWFCICRQGMRRAGLQFIEDRVPNDLRLAAQLRIPKPQRLDAARLEKLFPFQIVFPLFGKTVLAAVQFDVQFRLLAKEIQIIVSQRMLATKLVCSEPPVTQPTPHQLFRPSFNLTKLAGALNIGHGANLRNGRTSEKFVLTTALTCFLSPRERILPSHALKHSSLVPANPTADHATDAGSVFPLSLGRGPG